MGPWVGATETGYRAWQAADSLFPLVPTVTPVTPAQELCSTTRCCCMGRPRT